jgi:hypothetical protein
LAPSPRASATTTMALKPGVFRSKRQP